MSPRDGARKSDYGRTTGRTRIGPRRYTPRAEDGRFIDMVEYKNKTGHYICAVEDFIDDDESAEDSINGRYESTKVSEWN